MTDAIVDVLLKNGTMGAVCVMLLFVIHSLYTEVKEERKGRLEDSKVYREAAVMVHQTATDLAKVVEYLEEEQKNRRR